MSSKRAFEISDLPGELDLREICISIWKGKIVVLLFSFVFLCIFAVIAFKMHDVYKSEALLAPVSSQDDSGLASQLGGLASVAGIELNTGGGIDKTSLAIEILQSRKFISEFIEKHDLLVDIMAAKSWDPVQKKLSYDPDIYDVEKKLWVREVDLPRTPKPSQQEAFEAFLEMLDVQLIKKTGLVSIAIEHNSPVLARDWVNLIISEINMTMKERDVTEAKRSLHFLNKQLKTDDITSLRAILYKLMEDETKTIMLAEVRDEYVFTTIDPAIMPERKEGPKRAMLCILGAFIGLLLGMFTVVSVSAFKGRSEFA
ncbi:LPS O-antigen length regulator [Pseudoalteromonas rubra]|uniref:LPS O-antigen length regulator n=1 Tax=Pseudoalteromonas rubra TaxID=43658 RepID=A0A5S3WSR4_9GAMM|nr:Wzz/FepE/Etk N-terminal domain-containing protein [Pseudoalteromonas rubra]MCO7188721.1 Wzz/FepE/Etk N-terminal domain-containing protein [Pseudoalteromonas sp. XMcav2-N]TMP31472.1 LPS O-antigen length regulator [Pseudoalteromonas rubra]TMP34556.1 LPS O-antigen length regulator [Pseudoalteromonas rubra]